ncbi:hypothetical protein OUZ56_032235 [Daphnia magna]|uniref:Uncharacterized protein n=1 Tax=Daphnia magna TaxID=35525 RepID=A0ABQ9ZWV9_9CRUS|nr:hypothetical protein OUZ56_032235 [Daphnia magna]
MEPFTQALDLLQDEETMSIGCVIPTIKLLIEKIEDFSKDPTIIHCIPLVSAVLDGLKARFHRLMHENHLIIASISDPMFKLIWVDVDDAKKVEYTTLLKGAVRRVKVNRTEATSAISIPDYETPKKNVFLMAIIDGHLLKSMKLKRSVIVVYLLQQLSRDYSVRQA